MSAGLEGSIATHIAQQLTQIADQISAMGSPDQLAERRQTNINLGDTAKKLYRARRSRGKLFEESLFGEPAWDIMLDLFINGERGIAISISSACQAAAVPTSTALRCVKLLLEKGILDRRKDCDDGRRSFLVLSDEAHARMSQLLMLLG